MVLTIDNVIKEFQHIRAVDKVSYSMENGVYGLLGANGAGKTTLMRMLCTLIHPTEGTISWDGHDIFGLGGAYRQLLGYLPQDFGYYPDLSVNDYMLYISSIKGLRPIVAKKRTHTLLKQVDMVKQSKQKMRNLSGGMLRRVGIAQAMLNNPKILILDEPTAGLDPSERIRFRNLISELSNDRLILLSTHIVSDVEFIANEIIIMKQGQFFFTGTAEKIVSSMNEKVWHCEVPKNEVAYLSKKYLVANVKAVGENVELRVLSKRPVTEQAVQEQATLEDAYLHYFGEKSGEEDDT